MSRITQLVGAYLDGDEDYLGDVAEVEGVLSGQDFDANELLRRLLDEHYKVLRRLAVQAVAAYHEAQADPGDPAGGSLDTIQDVREGVASSWSRDAT